MVLVVAYSVMSNLERDDCTTTILVMYILLAPWCDLSYSLFYVRMIYTITAVKAYHLIKCTLTARTCTNIRETLFC